MTVNSGQRRTKKMNLNRLIDHPSRQKVKDNPSFTEYTVLEVAKMYNAPVQKVIDVINKKKLNFYGLDHFSSTFIPSLDDDMNADGYIRGLTDEQRRQMGEEIYDYKKDIDRSIKLQGIYTLDGYIIGICYGKRISEIAEKAIKQYAENPAKNVKEELKKIPLEKHGKSVRLSLSKETFKVLDGLCKGERIATAIIEVAIFRYINPHSDASVRI